MTREFVRVYRAEPHQSAEVDALFHKDMARREAGALLRSGPPVVLTDDERATLENGHMSMCVVAWHESTGTIVGYASLGTFVARARGRQGIVEDVVTDADFDGRGVGRAVMTSLVRFGFEVWRCRRINLVCEPHRLAARALYTSLGFVQQGDTDRFVCKEPVTTAYATPVEAIPGNDVFAIYALRPAVSR